MLGQRRRRWPNIEMTSGHSLVFAGDERTTMIYVDLDDGSRRLLIHSVPAFFAIS